MIIADDGGDDDTGRPEKCKHEVSVSACAWCSCQYSDVLKKKSVKAMKVGHYSLGGISCVL